MSRTSCNRKSCRYRVTAGGNDLTRVGISASLYPIALRALARSVNTVSPEDAFLWHRDFTGERRHATASVKRTVRIDSFYNL